MENNTYVEPFSDLFSSVYSERQIKIDDLRNKLEEMNIDISRRSLYRYLSGESTPSLEVARAICDLLRISIKESDLISSLNLDKDKNKLKKLQSIKDKKIKYLTKSISIPLKDFEERLGTTDGVETLKLIEQRLYELYKGDRQSFGFYVRDLIVEDLYEKILKGDNE